jgi:Rrf2 family protein
VRLSQKADYALRAALDLALHATGGGLTRTAEIARRTGAPVKFLEAILGEMRRAGLVESRRGAVGGHRLARSPARITAGQVWSAIDGPVAVAQRRRRPASDSAARALQGLWAEVEQAVRQVVDGATLEDLARRAQQLSNVQDFSI